MKYWCSWRGSLLNIILQLQRSHIKIQLHFPSCNPVFNTCFHQERKSILFCRAFLRLCSVCSKNKVGLQMSSRNSGVYFPRGDENSEYVQPWKGLGTLHIPKKKEAHSCSSSFCPRPRIISCKAPLLGVHTSCFVSYTAWAKSLSWVLITAAHGFFLSITHLTLPCFGVTWCLCPHPTPQERAGSCAEAGMGLAPSWPGFWGFFDWVNEVICWSIFHKSYIFLTQAEDFIYGSVYLLTEPSPISPKASTNRGSR